MHPIIHPITFYTGLFIHPTFCPMDCSGTNVVSYCHPTLDATPSYLILQFKEGSKKLQKECNQLQEGGRESSVGRGGSDVVGWQ